MANELEFGNGEQEPTKGLVAWFKKYFWEGNAI
jgi:hypothetical protein